MLKLNTLKCLLVQLCYEVKTLLLGLGLENVGVLKLWKKCITVYSILKVIK
jgi:hypothetical protein